MNAEEYRDLIMKAVENITDQAILQRIYKFVIRLWRSMPLQEAKTK